jgi:hypothetical protein
MRKKSAAILLIQSMFRPTVTAWPLVFHKAREQARTDVATIVKPKSTAMNFWINIRI